MIGSPAAAPGVARSRTTESREALPDEVARLLAAAPGPDAEAAWSAFLATYSDLLLRVASAFGPGYDGALDRYAYMLDELRRNDCHRLRGFRAVGCSRFSTWLVVVARRLCLDQYRLRYGRARDGSGGVGTEGDARTARRRLSDLAGTVEDLDLLADPGLSDPAERLDADHRRAALGRAIESLPPGDQLLLRLRFEEELSAREVAALLGLPTPFHVYRRLAGVCARLRVRLESAAVARPA
jgi:RNA polymerase sigma factor (sigma-70 family)